jgi:hypothetical protein
MEGYQIGNRVRCIVKAYSAACNIGSYKITYDNEPYTVIDDCKATIYFNDISKDASGENRVLSYQNSSVNSIVLSDVKLNDKITNMSFMPNTDNSAIIFTSKDVVSDTDGNIYIDAEKDAIFQVFVYDNDGNLEETYETLNNGTSIKVNNNSSNYLLCYGYPTENTYKLSSNTNNYFALDLETISNVDDKTNKMCLHFSKCSLKVDRTLVFNKSSNTIDITFYNLSNDNYIGKGN